MTGSMYHFNLSIFFLLLWAFIPLELLQRESNDILKAMFGLVSIFTREAMGKDCTSCQSYKNQFLERLGAKQRSSITFFLPLFLLFLQLQLWKPPKKGRKLPEQPVIF